MKPKTSPKDERRKALEWGKSLPDGERAIIRELSKRHSIPEGAAWMAYYIGTTAVQRNVEEAADALEEYKAISETQRELLRGAPQFEAGRMAAKWTQENVAAEQPPEADPLIYVVKH